MPITEAIPLTLSESLLAFVEGIAHKRIALSGFPAPMPLPKIDDYIILEDWLDHFTGLQGTQVILRPLGAPARRPPESIETSSLHLDILRDLKRIHSHICSVAYPVLEAAGELQPNRLKDSDTVPASELLPLSRQAA
jgi:hypothetical protein